MPWRQKAKKDVASCDKPRGAASRLKPACGSPRLIAACHVLLRLLAPRHSPYALSSLIIKLTQSVFLAVDVSISATPYIPCCNCFRTELSISRSSNNWLNCLCFFHSTAQLEQNL